jgi:hypothetical protein
MRTHYDHILALSLQAKPHGHGAASRPIRFGGAAWATTRVTPENCPAYALHIQLR